MQSAGLRLSGSRTLMLLWAFLCISVFIRYPGSASILHGSLLGAWSTLGPKLLRIDVVAYSGSFLLAFVGLLVFCLSCICAGAWVLPRLEFTVGLKSGGVLVWLACLGTAFTIGQGLLSVIFLTLAELHQFMPFYLVLTIGAAMGAGLRPLAAFFSEHPIRLNFRAAHLFEPQDGPALLITLAVILLSLLYSTARLSYDSVALYFSDAKITAMTHSLQYFVGDSFVVSLFHESIQYAALIQLFGDQAARMFSWANGLIVMLFSLAMARQLGLSREARLVLIALIVSSTAILDLMGDGKIEIVSTAPAMAALYWMIAASDRPTNRSYLLVGFLSGMAMAARPYNIFLMAAVIGIFQIQNSIRETAAGRAHRLRELGRALLWIGLGTLPWLAYHLASNWVLLGDPLAFIRNYQELSPGTWQWAVPPGKLWLFRLMYPLTVTFLNTPQSLGSISPLFVALVPLLFLKTARDALRSLSRRFLYLVTASIITLLLWILLTFMVFEIRYAIFLWIVLFMPLAAAIVPVLGTDPVLRNFTRLGIIVLLGFLAIRIVYISIDSYSPVDRQGNAHCYDLAACEFLTPINRMAHAGDRILTLGAYRYYLRADLFACSTGHAEYSSLVDLSRADSMAFWTEVYREGYDYLAYEQNYAVRHLNLGIIPGPDNSPPWLTLEPIYGKPGDPEVAYKIHASGGPVNIGKKCVRTAEGWEVQTLSNAHTPTRMSEALRSQANAR